MPAGHRARPCLDLPEDPGARRLLRLAAAAPGLHGDRGDRGPAVRRRRAGLAARGGAADFGNRREMLALTFGAGRGAACAARCWSPGRCGDMLPAWDPLLDLRGGCAARWAPRAWSRVADACSSSSSGGTARGTAGAGEDEITLPARVSEVATQALLFHRAGGPTPRAMCSSGPAVGSTRRSAECSGGYGEDLLRDIDAVDPWQGVLDSEPAPARRIRRRARPGGALFRGHGRPQVDVHPRSFDEGRRACGARRARSSASDEPAVMDLRRAGLLHDLGRVGVSSGIWDKPGAVDPQRARADAAARVPHRADPGLLAGAGPLGRIAGLHHERLDGSGYHHGLGAAAIPVSARVLAAADTFQTLTQDGPTAPPTLPGRRRSAWPRRRGRAARRGLRAGRGRGRGAATGAGRRAGRAGSATGRWRCCGWWLGGCRTSRSQRRW